MDKSINKSVMIDKIIEARALLMEASLSYPIHLHHEGKFYRFDSEDAEPVEVKYG